MWFGEGYYIISISRAPAAISSSANASLSSRELHKLIFVIESAVVVFDGSQFA
jgi:hypothetical protein